MKKTVILGNIITVDEKRPFAKAAFVRDGVFAYIGDADEAKKIAGADATILDYGENFIYPGFLEAHSHGSLAGDRAIGQADLSHVIPTDFDKYREIIKDFMAKNPDKEVYMAAGWIQNEEYKTKAYLDEICSDKPLFMNTIDGHSMLLNTKAMEWAGIDAEYAKKHGYDQVHVDKTVSLTVTFVRGRYLKSCLRFPNPLKTSRTFCLPGKILPYKMDIRLLPMPELSFFTRALPKRIMNLKRKAS